MSKERRVIKSALRDSLKRTQAMAREMNGDLDALAALLDEDMEGHPPIDDARVAHAIDTLIPKIEAAVRSLIAAFSIAMGIDLSDEVDLMEDA